MKNSLKKILLSFAVTFGTAAAMFFVFRLGSICSEPFDALKKPFLFPSANFFFHMCFISCFFSSVAVFRVLTSVTSAALLKNAVSSYLIGLLFYFVWSMIFFLLKEYFFAFFWFFPVIFFAICAMRCFSKTDRFAGCLIIPQVIITGYAGYLIFFIWLLN